MIGLGVEQWLDGGLDRQVLDPRGLNPSALDGVAKGPPELAGTGAEVEQPRGLAGRRIARRATMVTKIVVHPEQGVADGLGLVRQALETGDGVLGLQEAGGQRGGIDSVAAVGPRSPCRGDGEEEAGGSQGERAHEHLEVGLAKPPPPFKRRPVHRSPGRATRGRRRRPRPCPSPPTTIVHRGPPWTGSFKPNPGSPC